MGVRWKGLIAPVEVPTGDGRMFASGKMTHRPVPFPLMVRFTSGGHDGAMPVGTVDRIFDGPGGYWGEGEFLDAEMVPEVPRAIYMLQKKVMGPSVDLDRDFTVEAIAHPSRVNKKAGLFREYNVIGITLVPMPAFHQVHMSVDNEQDKALLASAGVNVDELPLFDVNTESWRNWEIAPRDYTFDADDAVKRIAYWSGIGSKEPSIDRYSSAFLWRNGNQVGDSLAQDSFRLPLVDIINDQPYLIYHAVYSAAALLSGAHGGLPNIPDEDKAQMVGVINEIYAALAEHFGDPNLRSPFVEGDSQSQYQASINSGSEDCGCSEMTNVTINIGGDGMLTATSTEGAGFANPLVFAGMKEPYGDVAYADPGFRDGTKRYPIDTPEHVRAAISYLSMPKNADKYDEDQLQQMWERIREAADKFGIELSHDYKEMAADTETFADSADTVKERSALIASVSPLAPPAAWFSNPQLGGPTRLTIDDDGHVFGHLAQWKVCHVGIGKQCVMAPKTRTNYQFFLQGKIRTDDGSLRDIGKITLGTGHADGQWGIIPSREHYDNTGWAAAVVNVGEDRFGIWVNGALTSTMTPERVAEFRAAALSGDWREVNGNLELIAALAVNNPGFPIYRESAGRAFSLVSVGVIGMDDEDVDSMENLQDTVDTQFAVTTGPEEVDEVEVDEVEVDPELAARMERLAMIDDEMDDYRQDRRAAQLAAIDAEWQARQNAGGAATVDEGAPPRQGVASPGPGRSLRDNIFIQYNAKYQAVDEE